MKIVHIKEKLKELDVSLEEIRLGDFDQIGRFTAERQRGPSDPGYNSVGSFYRANYERGILIYYLIRKYRLTSMLEIGFGRGYSCLCAAKAFYDAGINGTITTIDPKFNNEHIQLLKQIFPKELFSPIKFVQGYSGEALKSINEKFDLVYIDGDHSYEGTKSDWDLTKDKFNKFVLFDDYHMSSKIDPGIQCSKLIDEIVESDFECDEKELLIQDRRIFFDDRRIPDDQIDYGQVLLKKSNVKLDNDW